MKLEDYSKYCIQGSDHYLIPKDEFEELFDEVQNWKNESLELKKQYCERTDCCGRLGNSEKVEQLQKIESNWNELKVWLEKDIKEYEEIERDVLKPSLIVMTKIVVLDKMQEIENRGKVE